MLVKKAEFTVLDNLTVFKVIYFGGKRHIRPISSKNHQNR